MAVSVHFRLIPPPDPGVVRLDLYESASPTGPWVLIDTFTDIGEYPDYIPEYTSNKANSLTNWFAIEWVDVNGARTELSNPIKGGTSTLLGEVISRTLMRNRNLEEGVVAQEAELMIDRYTKATPYGATSQVALEILNGLVYITLARVLTLRIVAEEGLSATIGLVSFKKNTQKTIDAIQPLLDLANQALHISYSTIMLLEEVTIGSSISTWQFDQSRGVLSIGMA